jgi:hypothetical protein
MLKGAQSNRDPVINRPFVPVTSVTFFFYCCFLIEFFFRLSSRVPVIGLIRPTLLLVLIISTLLLFQKKAFKSRELHNITQAVNVLIIYLFISLPFVTFPGSVLFNNSSEFVKAIAFFYFTMMVIDTPGRLKKFLVIFITCQIIRVMEPLYLNITTGYWGDKTHMGGGEFANRLAGGPHDVINPNELGFVIVTIIPFLHYFLLPRGFFKKITYVVLMAALLYALILTMSRGAFLALLVVGYFVFRDSKHKLILLIVALLIATGGWTLMSSVQKDRYLSLIGQGEEQSSRTAEGRLTGMLKEFELGLRRPIFGHGLGTTPEAKYNFTGKRQASHNLYAELLIEIGFIGMVIFFRILQKVYKNFKKLRSSIPGDHIESLRLLKVMTCIFFMYLVYSSNYWGLSQYYWYLFAGLSVAFIQISLRNPDKDIF